MFRKLCFAALAAALAFTAAVSCSSTDKKEAKPAEPQAHSSSSASVTVTGTVSVVVAPKPAEPISPDPGIMRKHIEFLTSDELAGRKFGRAGALKAAGYIVDRFAEYGVAPGNGASYMQEFPVTLLKAENPGLSAMVKKGESTELVVFEKGKDFIPYSFSPSTGKENYLELFFAGYGISAPEFKYDDYEGADVKGKAVMVVTGEPSSADPNYFDGEKPTKHSGEMAKVLNAQKHGAAAVLFVWSIDCKGNPPIDSGLAVWPDMLPDRTMKRVNNPAAESMNVNAHDMAIVGQARATVTPEPVTMPAFVISAAAAEKLSGGECFCERAVSIDATKSPCSEPIIGAKIMLSLAVGAEKVTDRNVIGLVKGTDPELSKEFVIVGAHYDHLGTNAKGDVFRGASDNASGTSGMLEIARAVAARPLKRSVLFIAFGAEEIGLIGSSYFTSHPTIALDKVVAMLNIDMIGRSEGDQVWVLGEKRNPELFALAEARRKEAGVALTYMTNAEFAFMGGSDHWPFHLSKVPSLDFTTSRFAEEHTIGDTIDKVDFAKVTNIIKGVLLLAEAVADSAVKFPVPLNPDIPYPSRGGKDQKYK